MNIALGLAQCMRNAWHMLDFVIFEASSFGGNQDITLKNILTLILGGIVLVKFVRFCMGGNFNSSSDRVNFEMFSNYVTHPYMFSYKDRRKP